MSWDRCVRSPSLGAKLGRMWLEPLRGKLAVCVLWILAAAAPVVAEPESDYEALIRRAVVAYQARDLDLALDLFQQAHTLDANARTERAVGITLFEMHQRADALSWLNQALRDPRRALTAEQRAEAEDLISQASAPVQTTTATQNQPAPPSKSNGLGTRRSLAIVTGVVGVIAVGVGSVAGVSSISARARSDRHCPRDCDKEGVDAMNDSMVLGTTSTVAFVVGGASLAAALVLWWTGDRADERRSPSVSLDFGPTAIGLHGNF